MLLPQFDYFGLNELYEQSINDFITCVNCFGQMRNKVLFTGENWYFLAVSVKRITKLYEILVHMIQKRKR